MPKTLQRFKKGERVFISSTETFATIQDITPNEDGKILVQMYISPSQISILKNDTRHHLYDFSDKKNLEGLSNVSCVSENGKESKTILAALSSEDDVSDLPDLSAPVNDDYSREDEEEEEEEDINTQVGRMLFKETVLRKKGKCPNYAESDEDYQSATDDDDLIEYNPPNTPGRKRKYERKNTEKNGSRKCGKKKTKSLKSAKLVKKNTRSSGSFDMHESTYQHRPNYAESDEDYQSDTDEDDIIYLNHVRRRQIRAKVKEEESRKRKTRRKSSRDDDYEESEDDF